MPSGERTDRALQNKRPVQAPWVERLRPELRDNLVTDRKGPKGREKMREADGAQTSMKIAP